jgi:hypothetical protein
VPTSSYGVGAHTEEKKPMLKKALACATLAVAATGAAVSIAAPAMASDTSGGNYSQNNNLVPHTCLDLKNDLDGIGLVGVNLPILDGFQGQQCNEHSKVHSEDKEPLSDLIDAGAYQK